MMRRPGRQWGRGAKVLHWLFVALLLIEIPAGFLMAYSYGPALKDASIEVWHDAFSQIHHTLGVVLLVLAMVRLYWRWRHPVEAGPARGRFHTRLVASSHASLYLLLLLLPLSGWLAVSALADSPLYGKTHLWFFVWDDALPRLVEPGPYDAPWGYMLFARMHVYLLALGALLLGTHVCAALWHHFFLRDDTLKAMLPGTCAGSGEGDVEKH